jgi:hypothetical protein
MNEVQINDVVQLDPLKTTNPMFAGCMLVVTEVKEWGVQGYVQGLGVDGELGGQAYYRAEIGTFEYVGSVAWVIACAKPEQNQCDGCKAGFAINERGNHVNADGIAFMSCQRGKYE